jgi:hypothetical protein
VRVQRPAQQRLRFGEGGCGSDGPRAGVEHTEPAVVEFGDAGVLGVGGRDPDGVGGLAPDDRGRWPQSVGDDVSFRLDRGADGVAAALLASGKMEVRVCSRYTPHP